MKNIIPGAAIFYSEFWKDEKHSTRQSYAHHGLSATSIKMKNIVPETILSSSSQARMIFILPR
jgi:hypothetical protein